MKKLLNLLLTCQILTLLPGRAEQLGDEVHYSLVKSDGRTSGIIQDGDFSSKISNTPDNTDPSITAFTLDCAMGIKAIVLGKIAGVQEVKLEEYYYSAEFKERIKQEKKITTEWFTIEYIGEKDVTVGNLKFENCMEVLITEIHTKAIPKADKKTKKLGSRLSFGIFDRIWGKGGAKSVDIGEIQDLTIRATIVDNIPVIRAATIDLTGKFRGFDLSLGFDISHSTPAFPNPQDTPSHPTEIIQDNEDCDDQKLAAEDEVEEEVSQTPCAGTDENNSPEEASSIASSTSPEL